MKLESITSSYRKIFSKTDPKSSQRTTVIPFVLPQRYSSRAPLLLPRISVSADSDILETHLFDGFLGSALLTSSYMDDYGEELDTPIEEWFEYYYQSIGDESDDSGLEHGSQAFRLRSSARSISSGSSNEYSGANGSSDEDSDLEPLTPLPPLDCDKNSVAFPRCFPPSPKGRGKKTASDKSSVADSSNQDLDSVARPSGPLVPPLPDVLIRDSPTPETPFPFDDEEGNNGDSHGESTLAPEPRHPFRNSAMCRGGKFESRLPLSPPPSSPLPPIPALRLEIPPNPISWQRVDPSSPVATSTQSSYRTPLDEPKRESYPYLSGVKLSPAPTSYEFSITSALNNFLEANGSNESSRHQYQGSASQLTTPSTPCQGTFDVADRIPPIPVVCRRASDAKAPTLRPILTKTPSLPSADEALRLAVGITPFLAEPAFRKSEESRVVDVNIEGEIIMFDLVGSPTRSEFENGERQDTPEDANDEPSESGHARLSDVPRGSRPKFRNAKTAEDDKQLVGVMEMFGPIRRKRPFNHSTVQRPSAGTALRLQKSTSSSNGGNERLAVEFSGLVEALKRHSQALPGDDLPNLIASTADKNQRLSAIDLPLPSERRQSISSLHRILPSRLSSENRKELLRRSERSILSVTERISDYDQDYVFIPRRPPPPVPKGPVSILSRSLPLPPPVPPLKIVASRLGRSLNERDGTKRRGRTVSSASTNPLKERLRGWLSTSRRDKKGQIREEKEDMQCVGADGDLDLYDDDEVIEIRRGG